MSDFVLRGYCKKCEQEVDWDSFEKGYFCAPCGDKNGNYVSKHPSEPEWFLSVTNAARGVSARGGGVA